MADHKKKPERILHGNQAKISPGEDAFFCHSYEAKTRPRKFGFSSLPGSGADLKNAREEYWEEEDE